MCLLRLILSIASGGRDEDGEDDDGNAADEGGELGGKSRQKRRKRNCQVFGTFGVSL